MEGARFRTIAAADIGLIRPLWEKLNRLHRADSPHFKDHFASFTFEKRIKPWLALAPGDLLATVVEASGVLCGYCVSSAHTDGSGEIESLYLEPELRGQGVGARLAGAHLAWLKERGCSPIRVAVAFGHDSVFPFYEKLGFFPRTTHFEYKG